MSNPETGKRVRKLRDKYEWTLKELSHMTGISVGFLGDIESGRTNPSLNTLNKLAEALRTTSDYLLGRSDEAHSETQDPQNKTQEDIKFEKKITGIIQRSGKKMTPEDKRRILRIIEAAIPADDEDE